MVSKYTSKIGLEFILLAYLPFISLLYFLYTEFNLTGLLTLIGLFIIINYLVLTTKYVIYKDSKKLLVKSGFIVHKNIPIESIKSIKKSKNWISSPALSIDRIEITYNKFDSILISPKNRVQFINELQQINPTINYV